MKTRLVYLTLVLILAAGGAATAQTGDDVTAQMQVELMKVKRDSIALEAFAKRHGEKGPVTEVMNKLIPIVFCAGLFVFLILRQYYQKKVDMAAIEKGIFRPPEKSPKDLRKPALVLVALGLGYFIAMQVTFGYMTYKHAPVPLQVSIWGIVPILIGVALWMHCRLKAKEQEGDAGSAG